MTMSEHPRKAEYLVWLDAPDVWGWYQRENVFNDEWSPCKPPTTETPQSEVFLLPHAWVKDPESVSVTVWGKGSGYKYVLAPGEAIDWDHSKFTFEVAPKPKPLRIECEVPAPVDASVS